MDRAVRSTNMLMWNKELWLIDHGAALYFHHADNIWDQKASQNFGLIQKHVLLQLATRMAEAHEIGRIALTEEKIKVITALISGA